MKTQVEIWDSLYSRPITKAALVAYLGLSKDFGLGMWGRAQLIRADSIAKRFQIKDLVLQWRNASPIN